MVSSQAWGGLVIWWRSWHWKEAALELESSLMSSLAWESTDQEKKNFCFSNCSCLTITWRARWNTESAGFHPRMSGSVGLESSLRDRISNKLPGNADAAGPETAFWEPLLYWLPPLLDRQSWCCLLFLKLFIYYLWLCWVFISVRGLSLVAASGGHSSSRCAGLSFSQPLL